ncbi:hypothetical protein Clacol_007101 [Clathrus columnatus]|uniref:NAD(P)-binding protein n=1 Tax=Clathrus columnatus TaxID=1419009 RepID=A0AAV5ADZ5_9AGAM|nr:hypothetical protein Clacol_007101 [Clathrus columnatus]
MSTLPNRIAIVTGSAQGIGRAVALRLAEDGCDVVINDLPHQSKLMDEVKSEVESKGRKSLAIIADISKEDEVEHLVKKTIEELGGLDIMVANAGVAVFNPILQSLYLVVFVLIPALSDCFVSATVEEWTDVVHTNTLGAMLCYKAAAKVMIEQGRGGAIIGAASLASKKSNLVVTSPLSNSYRYKSFTAGAFCSSYGSSKFAIRALTETAAAEWGPHNIRVNAYAPGATDTPLLKRMDARLAEILQAGPGVYINSMIQVTAMGRIAQPEEIAKVVSFLASDDAGFVTGKYHSFQTGLLYQARAHVRITSLVTVAIKESYDKILSVSTGHSPGSHLKPDHDA